MVALDFPWKNFNSPIIDSNLADGNEMVNAQIADGADGEGHFLKYTKKPTEPSISINIICVAWPH